MYIIINMHTFIQCMCFITRFLALVDHQVSVPPVQVDQDLPWISRKYWDGLFVAGPLVPADLAVYYIYYIIILYIYYVYTYLYDIYHICVSAHCLKWPWFWIGFSELEPTSPLLLKTMKFSWPGSGFKPELFIMHNLKIFQVLSVSKMEVV